MSTAGSIERSEHADIILMDDDILCEPETVLRLRAFANLTVEPTLVGAQMLFLLNPDYLNVGAEEVHLGELKHGQKVPKALRNTSMLKKNQERRVDAGYNAWWTCLIPAEVVARIGLPLPIFFQWDDVEYGLRARAAGFVTVTLPNAAVWHADFYWKDYDDWARYFSMRNSLDRRVDARRSGSESHYPPAVPADRRASGRDAVRPGAHHAAGHRGLPDAGRRCCRTAESPPWRPRAARGRTIRRRSSIRSRRPPVKAADIEVRRDVGDPSRPLLVLIKRAVQQWTGRTQPGVKSVTREDAHWWHVSLFDHVMVTDASQSGVRIRRRDKEKARALLLRTIRVLRRLRARTARAEPPVPRRRAGTHQPGQLGAALQAVMRSQ